MATKDILLIYCVSECPLCIAVISKWLSLVLSDLCAFELLGVCPNNNIRGLHGSMKLLLFDLQVYFDVSVLGPKIRWQIMGSLVQLPSVTGK